MNRRLLVLGPLALLVGGCPPPPVARPYAPPSAEELYAAVTGRAAAIQTQRTETKVDLLADKDQRVKLGVTFLTQAPNRLRMEAEGPFSTAVASLASDGADFQFLDIRNNRFLAGPAQPCSIARLIRVALRPSDVVAVLDGVAPIIDSAPDARAVDWDPHHGGREVLRLRGADGSVETLEFDARERRWDLVDAELRDGRGQVVWHVEHQDFALVEGGGPLRLPGRSAITQPSRNADARIRYKSRELGVTPPEGVFQLAPPPGIPVEQVSCD